jgi:hypothetical protein
MWLYFCFWERGVVEKLLLGSGFHGKGGTKANLLGGERDQTKRRSLDISLFEISLGTDYTDRKVFQVGTCASIF